MTSPTRASEVKRQCKVGAGPPDTARRSDATEPGQAGRPGLHLGL